MKILYFFLKHVDSPYIRENKIEIQEVGFGFFRVIVYYGFMETPNVPQILKAVEDEGLRITQEDITYYLGRESLLITDKPTMMKWRKSLFSFMSKNAQRPTDYFSIPPNRVVELGMQIEI